MADFDYGKYRRMVRSFQERDDPTGWFEDFYREAGGDPTAVFWADLAPNPCLLQWLAKRPSPAAGKKALVIGCGVGDNSEALSAHGYRVTAFDIARSAIEMCRKRFPETKVEYRVEDLFRHPPEWREAFDLVWECNTIQILHGKYRAMTRDAIVGLVAPGGDVLVSCRSRKEGEQEDDIPLPLTRHEIDGFVRAGLVEQSFEAYDDDQDPPVPHFFAWYSKSR